MGKVFTGFRIPAGAIVCAATAPCGLLAGHAVGGGAVAGGDIAATEGGTAAEQGARFITNAAGETLDTSRITIPAGKFDYLLKNPSKAGVFRDSMGYDETSLGAALRGQLTSNFGSA